MAAKQEPWTVALDAPKPKKPWRLSASVIIAVPREVAPRDSELSLSAASCDYAIAMVKRTAKASFMADAMVFPGGAVDAGDSAVAHKLLGLATPEATLKVAGAREVFEEVGMAIVTPSATGLSASELSSWRAAVHDGGSDCFRAFCGSLGSRPATEHLHFFSSFITPDMEAARLKKGGFDARFYLYARAGPDELAHLSSDQTETVSLVWLAPDEALAASEAGKIYLAPPQVGVARAVHLSSSETARCAHASDSPRLQGACPYVHACLHANESWRAVRCKGACHPSRMHGAVHDPVRTVPAVPEACHPRVVCEQRGACARARLPDQAVRGSTSSPGLAHACPPIASHPHHDSPISAS